jgi:hypothetical protein
MDDRQTKRILGFLLLATILSLATLATPTPSASAIQGPGSAEPRPSARRTAARGLERRSSTQWLSDVAERIRILEEQAERAATSSSGQRAIQGPTLVPGRTAR